MSSQLFPINRLDYFAGKHEITKNGFYVRAKPNKCRGIKGGIKYVVRYTGCPVMAQSRIINYDGKSVTFYYQRHEDNKRVEETISAFDFIKRLIIHIPDIGFKMIRYYGIYSQKHKSHGKMVMLFNKQQLKIQKMMNRWQLSIISDFHHNCPCNIVNNFNIIALKTLLFVRKS
ncbi:MAG: transposase [Ruminiclostridium sp.]